MRLSDIFTYQFEPGKLFKIPEQPLNAFLDLTNQCNNYCLFCYNDDSAINDPDHDKIKSIVNLLGSTGTKEIMYLGGEPIAYPYLIEVLETGKNQGMFQRTVSNGSYFKSVNFCRSLKNAGLNEVGISFHSFKKEIHDKLSGREGAYVDAINGLENCIKADLPVFIQYSPNQLNAENDINEFACHVLQNYSDHIKLFDVNRLLPVGRGKDCQDIILKEDQWFNFLVRLTEVLDMAFEVRVELSPHCWLKRMAERKNISEEIVKNIFSINRGCYMWIAQLPLDCNGNIKFCPAGEQVGPNILEVEWPKFWQSNELFDQYRTFLWNHDCIDYTNEVQCNFFYRCLGGCKATAQRQCSIDSLYNM